MSTTGKYRRVTSPLTAEALQPLTADDEGIQFSEPLLDDDYLQLADLFERQPDKRLMALQLDSTRRDHITDLAFCQYFPRLRRFSSSLELLESLDGIDALENVEELFVFKPLKRMSAAQLAALTSLEYLWLDGQFSDRDALRALTNLANFKLGYAAKLPDLSFLPPHLTRFSMNLGSVTDIGALADLAHLRRLAFHKVNGIADLTPLANATSLHDVQLSHLDKVTHLFDMSALTGLTELSITALSNLTDLRPVLTAPNLRTLRVYDVPSLDAGSWHDTCAGWLAQGKPPFWD